MPPSIENTPFVVFMNIGNTVTQILLGTITCSAFLFANLSAASTSMRQHIYLCVIGYIILMSQAILSLSPFSSWSSTFKYQEKKNIHWVMQILGSILAITGSIIRISNISSHFQSAHGAFGIFALIFTFCSLIGGLVNFFSSKTNINPNIIKIAHSSVGSLTIMCAFLCLIFAFDKAIFRLIFSDSNSTMLIIFTVLALIGTLFPACSNLMKRIRN